MAIEFSQEKNGVLIVRVGNETVSIDPKRRNGYLVSVNGDDDGKRPTRIIK